MKLRIWLFLVTTLFGAAPLLLPVSAAESITGAAQEINALLSRQSEAWNRGDIESFMQAYAPTDDLRFASGGTVTRGWRTTLERYKQRYPDKAAMGVLAFTELDIT